MRQPATLDYRQGRPPATPWSRARSDFRTATWIMTVLVAFGIFGIVASLSDYRQGEGSLADVTEAIVWNLATLLFTVGYAVGHRRLTTHTLAAAYFCRRVARLNFLVWAAWMAADTISGLTAPDIGVPCLAIGSLVIAWALVLLPVWLALRAHQCVRAARRA